LTNEHMCSIIRTYVHKGFKMRGLGRRKKERCINANHADLCFKPCGIKASALKKVILFEDEMEAIRLADFEGLYQEECADKMNISRTTFSRVVANARRKVADALLNNKILEVKI